MRTSIHLVFLVIDPLFLFFLSIYIYIYSRLVLEITNTSLSEFDFLVNGVMAEVMALIEQVIPKIFWPAIPDVFYQVYVCF